jgi:hypothetical protein
VDLRLYTASFMCKSARIYRNIGFELEALTGTYLIARDTDPGKYSAAGLS